MASSSIQPLSDTSELVELFQPHGLYLKAEAKLNISVSLPQLKDPGQSISNWDLMERIKKLIHPVSLNYIRVVKSTIEFVRFEAELTNREQMRKVVQTLDNASIKVIGFYETLKVKAGEAKSDFPTRHDWDSFFRDARNMNEMHPGERPDTVYFGGLPCKWFVDRRHRSDTGGDKETPSEFVLKRMMEQFGEIRCVDIPVSDPYRQQMSRTGLRATGSFNFGGELTFEGYVQFMEYISFVKAMDTFRGMKLVHFDESGKKFYGVSIKVDFDRSKHLCDKSIRRRRLERERLVKIDTEKKRLEEERRREEEAIRISSESAKASRRENREEKRRLRNLERRRLEDEKTIERKIRLEERKLLVAQRKLESMRLLAELLKRVKAQKQKDKELKKLEAQQKREETEALEKEEEANLRLSLLKQQEMKLKAKAVEKLKRLENSSREQSVSSNASVVIDVDDGTESKKGKVEVNNGDSDRSNGSDRSDHESGSESDTDGNSVKVESISSTSDDDGAYRRELRSQAVATAAAPRRIIQSVVSAPSSNFERIPPYARLLPAPTLQRRTAIVRPQIDKPRSSASPIYDKPSASYRRVDISSEVNTAQRQQRLRAVDVISARSTAPRSSVVTVPSRPPKHQPIRAPSPERRVWNNRPAPTGLPPRYGDGGGADVPPKRRRHEDDDEREDGQIEDDFEVEYGDFHYEEMVSQPSGDEPRKGVIRLKKKPDPDDVHGTLVSGWKMPPRGRVIS